MCYLCEDLIVWGAKSRFSIADYVIDVCSGLRLATESLKQEIEKPRAYKTTKSVYLLVYSSKLKIKTTEVQNIAFKIARDRRAV